MLMLCFLNSWILDHVGTVIGEAGPHFGVNVFQC